jgi:NADH-quinone oxidoreductase subunit L
VAERGAEVARGLGTLAEPPHGATETALVAVAVVVALVGLGLGWTLTLRGRLVPAREAVPEHGFWKVLYHKYYVDELYDRFIVDPLVALSRGVLWKTVDQGVIDGAGVNGSAALSKALGWLGSRLQTGQVGVYVGLFLVGALCVLGVVAWR